VRILVVEDEPVLAGNVAAALQLAGFTVDRAGSLHDANALLASFAYEAMVLDRKLPDGDGLMIVREMRQKGTSLAVLALTARDTIEDRVVGLDAGADDYLVKPFAMEELLARVRALLRRPGGVLGDRLASGNVALDTRTRGVEVAGQPLGLPRAELVVLETLLRRVGRVVERSVLLDQLYGVDENPPLNAVPVHVHHLRRRLEQAGATLEIVTFRGIGYMAAAHREVRQ
jgi:DNA-binding response OmpR family regulator